MWSAFALAVKYQDQQETEADNNIFNATSVTYCMFPCSKLNSVTANLHTIQMTLGAPLLTARLGSCDLGNTFCIVYEGFCFLSFHGSLIQSIDPFDI